MNRPRSSRQKYKVFREDYRQRRLDQAIESDGRRPDSSEQPDVQKKQKRDRREQLRDYVRWLKPHRLAVAAVFLLALLAAGLEMVEPLFMRHIVDRVLLNADLDPAAKFSRLHTTGALFLGVISSALPVIGVSPFWQMAISGTAIILAVVLNARGERNKGRIILKRAEGAQERP